jgi:hypothetical protein
MVVETENDDREASRIVEADKWKCPGCGIEIVAGFASKGLEFWQNGFAEALVRTSMLPRGEWCYNNTRKYQPTIQVTDEKRRIK